jgi:hypothetical protein
MTTPIFLAVPSKYSELFPCHGSTLRVLCPTLSSISQKPFLKPKPTLGNVVIFPTVHDRGLGYSNRFTSAEVVHFTHNHLDTHRVGIFLT